MKLGKILDEAKKANKSSPSGESKNSSFVSDKVFNELGERLKSTPQIVKQVKAVILWNVKGKSSSKHWTVDLKNGNGFVKEGKHGKPDVTITIGDQDYVNLVLGKLNPQQAFMSGKLKLKGNMSVAMKLDKVIGAQRSKL